MTDAEKLQKMLTDITEERKQKLESEFWSGKTEAQRVYWEQRIRQERVR